MLAAQNPDDHAGGGDGGGGAQRAATGPGATGAGGAGRTGAGRGTAGLAPARLRRDALAIVLSAVTGAMDAMSFLGLGRVFTSVVTANMVFLGISAGKRDATLALHVGTVLVTFVASTLIGARLLAEPRSGESHPIWPRRVSVALSVEGIVLVAVTVGWEIASARPLGAAQYLLLAGAAAVMGIQGSAIRALGVTGLSTTYVTGLFTMVLTSIVTKDDPEFRRRGLLILLALILGAAGSSALFVEAPRLLPVLPLVLLAGVLSCALLLRARDDWEQLQEQ